jgi:hypothetical protein
MSKNISVADVYSTDPRFTSDQWTVYSDEAKAKLESDAMALGGLAWMAETLACDNCKALYAREVEEEDAKLWRLTDIMECCQRCAPILALQDIAFGAVKLASDPPALTDITRTYSPSEALKAGHCAYWTNEPMPCGHIGWRYVEEGGCVDCSEAQDKASPHVPTPITPRGMAWLKARADEQRLAESKKRVRIASENAERSKARDTVRKRNERAEAKAEALASGEAPKRRGRPKKAEVTTNASI